MQVHEGQPRVHRSLQVRRKLPTVMVTVPGLLNSIKQCEVR